MIRNATRAATVLACCCLTACTSASGAAPEPLTVPFNLTEGLLILVRATAGGGISGQFIVDTGAGIHVASPSFLTALQARPAGRYTGFRHTGERVDFDVFRISSLSVGPATQQNPLVGRWALLDQLKIAGILSAKLFERQPVTLDFKARQLVFETSGTLERRARGGGIARLGTARDREVSLDLFAHFVISRGTSEVEAECKLDTGLDGLVADTRLMAPLGLEPDSPAVTKRETTSPFGASETQYRTAVGEWRLRDQRHVRLADPEVVFKDRLTGDCLVGTRFWLDRLVTIDLAGARLIVH